MKKCLLSFLIAAALFSTLAAEEKKEKKSKNNTLQYHMVITAGRIEQSALELGSSTTVLTDEDLKKSGKKTLAEALSVVPGISITQNGGTGKSAHVFIRGAKSEHTLVMIDGIEINDPMSPGRSFDIAHMDLSNVARIEIVRGPQSTLYGSDAMGGVINIITRKGTGKPKITLSAENGAYNSFRESAGINGGTKKINYSIELSRFDTKGFSASHEKYGNTERDGYDNTTLSARLGLNPLANLNFNLFTRYTNADSDLDGSGGLMGDDPNFTEKSQHLLLALSANLRLIEHKWEQKLVLSYNRQNRDYRNDPDQQHPLDSAESFFSGDTLKVDWQHNLYFIPHNVLSAGIEYEKETGESENRWDSAWGPGISLFPRESCVNTGIYFQNNLKIKESLFVSLGARLDNHSRFGSQATYRIAPAYMFKSRTKIKATYGTGFKAPSLYQLYAPASIYGPAGNLDLQPEKNQGWDLGIEQYLFNDKLCVSFTYFNNDFQNLIDFDWSLGFINIARAESSGIELYFYAYPFKNFSLQGNYTYTKAINKTNGEELLNRPRHQANFSSNYTFFRKVNINLSMIYRGKRINLHPYPVRVEAEEYLLFHLALSYKINASFEVYGRIDNLLDEKYEAVLGYGTPERSAYLGIKVTL